MRSYFLLSVLLHVALAAQSGDNNSTSGRKSEGGNSRGGTGNSRGGEANSGRRGGNSGARPGTNNGTGSTQPFGKVITTCTTANSYALTFDDGPFNFTMKLLDRLKEANMKATFFVNGDNFSKLSERGPEVKRIINEGHQLGSHTFRHPDLSQISEDEVRSEMTLNDAEIKKIIGKTPTYMRPPFFSANDQVMKVLADMQYHIINADIDTKDFENTTPESNDQSFEIYKQMFSQGGTISLMHDVHNTTVNQLIPNVIPFLQQSGRKSLTVGECLGDPQENWYRADTINGKVIEGPTRRSLGNKVCGCGAH
ncbi:hypothetical protein L249_2843 [Ophiocordyceps polyrhachis-furcata BCC 54312]|uniref:NodB homology domain-containing protein n=1 Tax=Ophiocordyceps polyrhachis-furcata BCC 54312 TaxID=1330021 RepID=A0A367LPI9_9HYPO|nr:hypothetical protein L249_2843 [Ophiocordyceps polyrhachis-furcata BCC 54312]